MVRGRSRQQGTRTLDVLHLASALKLQVEVFDTFGRDQEKLPRVGACRYRDRN
jgi:hypothetical protein